MSDIHNKCLINNTSDLYQLKGFEKHCLVKSKSSGLVFMQRIPSEKELSDHYDGYPRNSKISNITIDRYNDLLDEFEKYRQNNTILEIGCGDGNFLVEAQKRDWKVYGTEFTQQSAITASSKGIKMNQGQLNPSNYQNDSFDIILSFEVIEHINNPLEETQNIFQLLRVEGLFYVTTPNFNALERFHLGAQYHIISYPEHLIYFTPATLNRLMKDVGFKRKKILTTGIYISNFKSKKQNP